MTCASRSAATCRSVDLVVGKSHSESDDIEDFPARARAFRWRHRCRPTRKPTPTSPSRLQVTVPIWSSGGTHSRVKQSSYRWQAAKQRVERVSRETERTARDAYLGVMSEISRVQALKQALESRPHRAASATEAGYDVGTRTAVDVLAARQHAGPGLDGLLAQPLRLHAQRAARSSRPRASSTARRSKT